MLDDASFLGCDLNQIVPQNMLVIESDGSHDRDTRSTDIGTVQPTPQANFKDNGLTLRVLKMKERQGCRELEKGGANPV